MRVLIVEDERKVAEFIRKGLQQEGYAVDVAADGEEGLHQALHVDYDLVVLDVMLPRLSGIEVLERLRPIRPQLPVLLLTARSEVSDRVAGLNAGADDYLVKPFALAELTARLRALLRRGMQMDSRLRFHDLEMDTARRTVARSGRTVELKPKEYSLLEFLLRNAGRPVSRTMILEHVWDIHFDSMSNVVEVHINSLRNKIDKGFDQPLIHTMRGVGYILTDERS